MKKDSTDPATLCNCAAVRHEEPELQQARRPPARAQRRYQVPQGLAFVICANLAITRASTKMTMPTTTRNGHSAWPGHTPEHKAPGAAKWVSKLCGSASSLRVGELPGCAKGQENDFHGSVSKFKLGLTRRSYTRARRPICFSITRTLHEQRSAKRPPLNS